MDQSEERLIKFLLTDFDENVCSDVWNNENVDILA
jgi:hypothetical protein